MSYRQLCFTLRFLTPAFVGDAEQNARWRTPPFKHALREWWRVAWTADKNFNVNVKEMRREEGLLFGNAWLSHREGMREVADHRKSLVRVRLSQWNEGSLKKWPCDESVVHREVTNKDRVGSSLYLGYGPLIYDNQRRATGMKAAIQADESATLSVAFPATHAPGIERALWLMDRFGTLGGRSRNGWGSFQLAPADDRTPTLGATPLPLRPWHECLTGEWDWPHAIGCDDSGPLIWKTAPHADWKSLMKTLADEKIKLRTQFVFPPDDRPPYKEIEPRHWLSYPITTHRTRVWEEGARLPNQLRFKVRTTADSKLVGVLFHMPHLPPLKFKPDQRKSIQATWEKVHALLDESAYLHRAAIP